MHKLLQTSGLLMILLWGLVYPVSGQEVRDYEPFEYNDEWAAAARGLGNGDREGAVRRLLELSAARHGTTMGACAKLVAADNVSKGGELDEERAAELYDEVIRDYPNSCFAISAQLSKVCRGVVHLGDYVPSLLAGYDGICQDYGMPPMEAVLAADEEERGRLAAQVRAIHPQLRDGLFRVFNEICFLTYRQVNADQGITLALFANEAFEAPNYAYVARQMAFWQRFGRVEEEAVYNQGPPLDPTITPVHPLPGQVVAADLSEVVVSIHVGDYRNGLVVAPQLEFQLDGVDLRPQMWSSLQLDRQMREGAIYQLDTHHAVLAEPLAPGLHTLLVRAQTHLYQPGGPGRTEYTWTFTVAGGGPAGQTLPASQDSTLRSADPHQNEGANPRLVLSRTPEWLGRANNPVVAFDLSSVDLTGLTRATLVLDLRECELPRNWGPDGRYILAQRILSPWVEGNGKDLLLGPRQSTRGSGQGVTWFSPSDQDISNNGPNGSEQWQGARLATAPTTAPPVLVMNRQTGPVEFDVTQDVRAGAQYGWLIRKQDEARFGNIRFSSRDGGQGPRLVLEYTNSAAVPIPGLALAPLRGWLGPHLVALWPPSGPFSLTLGQVWLVSWERHRLQA